MVKFLTLLPLEFQSQTPQVAAKRARLSKFELKFVHKFYSQNEPMKLLESQGHFCFTLS